MAARLRARQAHKPRPPPPGPARNTRNRLRACSRPAARFDPPMGLAPRPTPPRDRVRVPAPAPDHLRDPFRQTPARGCLTPNSAHDRLTTTCQRDPLHAPNPAGVLPRA
ncbi:hypothetical protein GCM10009827_107970 [Dactylosporangium maewongense]|uniref:Uncharacterized protein n=1 Tax=Dactylosporangium maewongense TaxID=634393 RepID=A0ABN2D1K4_9ACTN